MERGKEGGEKRRKHFQVSIRVETDTARRSQPDKNYSSSSHLISDDSTMSNCCQNQSSENMARIRETRREVGGGGRRRQEEVGASIPHDTVDVSFNQKMMMAGRN